MSAAIRDKDLTTSEVARLLGVADRSVAKWCDQGRLPCYRVPMTRHRRIPRGVLVDFLLAEQMIDDALAQFLRQCVLARETSSADGTDEGRIDRRTSALSAAKTP